MLTHMICLGDEQCVCFPMSCMVRVGLGFSIRHVTFFLQNYLRSTLPMLKLSSLCQLQLYAGADPGFKKGGGGPIYLMQPCMPSVFE